MADYVPIANKGEEAIVRGVEDMLSDGRPVALGLFDNVPQVTQRENITLFPRDWLFRFEGNSALSGRGRILMQARIALELRLGSPGPFAKPHCPPGQNWRISSTARSTCWWDTMASSAWNRAGSFTSPRSTASEPGFSAPARGSEAVGCTRPGCTAGRWQESDFCIFREKHSCENMKQVCRDPGKLRVGPDPAFAMRPAPPEAAREILERVRTIPQSEAGCADPWSP